MARYNNSITMGNGFNITAQAPIDSRMVVEFVSDLTNEETWPNDIAPAYNGMAVVVIEDASIYVLKDFENLTEISSWQKVASTDFASQLVRLIQPKDDDITVDYIEGEDGIIAKIGINGISN